MADDRRIIIELKNIADQTAAAKTNKVADESSELLRKTLKTFFHPIQSLEVQSITNNAFVNQAVNQTLQSLKQIGSAAANYLISRYFTLGENYLAEVDFSNMMTTIHKLEGFASSTVSGAIVGAKGGAWGAAAGAVIGASTWGVTEWLGSRERKLQQQLTISTNNYQSQFQQTRLGLTEGRGVTNQ